MRVTLDVLATPLAAHAVGPAACGGVDAVRLLLGFVHQQTATMPAALDWSDLDAGRISAFLNHLEDKRRNSIRTRNVRLTAIRSLFSYAALRHPEHAVLIQRVLAIPPKRFDNGS